MLLGQIPICCRYVTDICHITVTDICHITVTDMLWGQIPICCRYVTDMSYNCDRYLSHNCERYVMGPNSYMLQICDRYFRTYILQIFYRTVTYICHISVSLVRGSNCQKLHSLLIHCLFPPILHVE